MKTQLRAFHVSYLPDFHLNHSTTVQSRGTYCIARIEGVPISEIDN